MSLVPIEAGDVLRRIAQFHTLIDARSPGEFNEDRLPGAVNWPVLDDDERRAIGTEYKQISPFDARKRGAALVARNVASHLERWVLDKPKGWLPLVYCWRGGLRSGTLSWFLGQIGFRVHVLQGGYKAFRAAVMTELETLPHQFNFTVICGRTGSGKTRLLHALAQAGAQVLDLEGLACHRGSVLGSVPGRPQPSQKAFETRLWHTLQGFDTARPVFVESESKKVGNLRVPEALIARMRSDGRCIALDIPDDARLQLLLEDYGYFADDVERFCSLLDALIELRGRERVQSWQKAARAGHLAEAFQGLMLHHYDPGYLRSTERNFSGYAQAERLSVADGSAPSMAQAARHLLA